MTEVRRIEKEKKTLDKLMFLYCRAHHNTESGELCEECNVLRDYAKTRIDKCVFGINKPTCQNCHVHCYKPEIKEEIIVVMRYSGPKMIYKHPLAAVNHFINKAVDKKKIRKITQNPEKRL